MTPKKAINLKNRKLLERNIPKTATGFWKYKNLQLK